MTSPTILADARHELSHRKRGRAERLARLAAAGAPIDDHEALAAWLLPRQRDAQQAAGVWFLAIASKRGTTLHEHTPRAVADLCDGGWFAMLPWGGTIGSWGTEAEALDGCRRSMLGDGWLPDWRRALAAAEGAPAP